MTKGEMGEEEKAEGIFEGVTVQNLTDEFRERLDVPDKIKGIVVTSVESGSVAEEFGLKSGDVVIEINKKPTKSVKDFNKAVSDIKKGEGVLVLLYRDGMTIYVTLSPSK